MGTTGDDAAGPNDGIAAGAVGAPPQCVGGGIAQGGNCGADHGAE